MEAARYTLDPDDPRAPSQELWDKLSDPERQRVVDSLPSEFELVVAPEGDQHRKSKERALQTLDEYFRRIHRKIYLSSELPVYYPDERMFAPDIIAVLDVESHQRNSWDVNSEGKGLDFVLEVHAFGNKRKDFELNVDRFARLRIPEYFAFDPQRRRLLGWSLGPEPTDGYVRIIPQRGRWPSGVLGLDLVLADGKLMFFQGSAELLDGRGLIDRLSTMVDDAVRKAEDEAQRAEQSDQRAKDEAQRAEDEAQRATEATEHAKQEAQRADRLAARLRELGVDPE
jgi:Uma2 family endonuclease